MGIQTVANPGLFTVNREGPFRPILARFSVALPAERRRGYFPDLHMHLEAASDYPRTELTRYVVTGLNSPLT